MDDLIERFGHASEAFRAVRGRVVAGEPWPLSVAYGTEPESDWGPKETIAHVNEMIPYWLGQIDRILATDGPEAVPFGRVMSDASRIERIGRDRERPASELFDRVDDDVASATGRLRELSADDAARVGLHARLGEMTVAAIVERFVIHHLEEHTRQLGEIVDAAAHDD